MTHQRWFPQNSLQTVLASIAWLKARISQNHRPPSFFFSLQQRRSQLHPWMSGVPWSLLHHNLLTLEFSYGRAAGRGMKNCMIWLFLGFLLRLLWSLLVKKI